MAKSDNTVIRCKTAGYSIADTIAAEPGPSKCGAIDDGVAFWHDRQGAWVIAYRDLVRIVQAAARVRGLRLVESSQSVAAVDPSVTDSGKPSTRDAKS